MKLLLTLFPLLLPVAARWAASQERRILREGVPLSAGQMATARLMGVAHPERIRLLKVSTVPIPGNFVLGWAAKVSRIFSPHTSGMSLRYGIFIRKEYWGNPHLIAHECVHTAQYERLGGFNNFLRVYLKECLEIGYPEAPLEQEAILKAHEIGG